MIVVQVIELVIFFMLASALLVIILGVIRNVPGGKKGAKFRYSKNDSWTKVGLKSK